MIVLSVISPRRCSQIAIGERAELRPGRGRRARSPRRAQVVEQARLEEGASAWGSAALGEITRGAPEDDRDGCARKQLGRLACRAPPRAQCVRVFVVVGTQDAGSGLRSSGGSPRATPRAAAKSASLLRGQSRRRGGQSGGRTRREYDVGAHLLQPMRASPMRASRTCPRGRWRSSRTPSSVCRTRLQPGHVDPARGELLEQLEQTHHCRHAGRARPSSCRPRQGRQFRRRQSTKRVTAVHVADVLGEGR